MKKILLCFVFIAFVLSCSNTKEESIFSNDEKYTVTEDKNFDYFEIQYGKVLISFIAGEAEDFDFTYSELNGIYHPNDDMYELGLGIKDNEGCYYYLEKDKNENCLEESIEDAKRIKKHYEEFLKEIDISEKELIDNLKKY